MPLHRIPPVGRPQDYKTYSLLAPLESHWRTATCSEIECAVSVSGWQTTVDEATDLGQRQAGYIRNQAGRHYTEIRNNGLSVFVFPAGEECFTTHKVKAEREPFYMVRRGDYRDFDSSTSLMHDTASDWVEDFAEHQDRLARR